MKTSFSHFYDRIKTGGLSLRMRFMLYVALAIISSVTLFFLLLSLFGIINPAYSRIEEHLDNQLDNHTAQTTQDIERLAAYSLSFSDQLAAVIDSCLSENGIAFDSLANNIEALTDIQRQSYVTVYTNVRTAPCSGAFYILNTTVNTSSEPRLYNGVYLKFANLYSDSTISTKNALFRGSSVLARENNINLSSTWQNEMKTGVFSDTSVFDEKEYIISSVKPVPDTWERARYIYSPIYGKDGMIIGICGFEINDLYMQLAYSAADKESAQTVCALLDKTENGYTGQFISNRSGYVPPEHEIISAGKYGSFIEYRCGNHAYIGKQSELFIDGNTLTIAIMFPKSQYLKIVRKGKLKNVAVLFIIIAVSFGACLWLSKKYIKPIRNSISQFKTKKTNYTPSGITEIDDLFAFLAEKDRKNEETLAEMENEKTKIQNTLAQVSVETNEAKQEIARLAYSRKNEIDPYDYEQFRTGVKTLTQMEQKIFELYLSGKKVKEIVEILGIKESTVRFHNRNIYSKLSVSSLKQLLLFAAVMKSQDGNNT